MEKILSVIIPMYNSKSYIEKCLESLILPKETQKKLDIIVVNDGSTDGCEMIADRYVSRYPETIRLLHKTNGGHGSAINHAIPFCRGRFFRVLDADDWFSSQELGMFLHELESIGQAEIILSSYHIFDIRTRRYHTIKADGTQVVLSMEDVIRRWSSFKQICSLHALTYQTAFYRRFAKRIPEGVYYDDAFYSTIPAYFAEKIAVTVPPVYVYRVGDVKQSVSTENRVKRATQLETVIWTMCDAWDGNVPPCNQAYYYRRVASAVADYLITVCLRHPKRKEGRRQACAFAASLKKRSPILFKHIRKKFVLLYTLSFLGMSESCFHKCMLMRQGMQR